MLDVCFIILEVSLTKIDFRSVIVSYNLRHYIFIVVSIIWIMKFKLYTFILYLTEKTVYLLHKEQQVKFVREINILFIENQTRPINMGFN
jgi:hypothetical protein